MFLLNLQSKVPIFEQIQTQIIRFIEVGVLKPGDKLPSVRQLAMENGINPNTVAKAYSELEKANIVYNLPKKGVYVADVNLSSSKKQHLVTVLESLKESGYSKEEMEEAIERIFQED